MGELQEMIIPPVNIKPIFIIKIIENIPIQLTQENIPIQVILENIPVQLTQENIPI